MPELPEVQTIVNDLNRKIVGEKIADFESIWKKNVRPSFIKFKKEIVGAKVIGVRRIGKQIIIDLDNSNSVLIHLKMSGHLLFKQKKTGSDPVQKKYFEERVNQYIRHKFVFESGDILDFSDLRKFGWLGVVKTEDVENTKEIQKLGIDALGSSFTLKKFKEILNKKQKSTIGVLLLDQSLIAGVGNIYRSEILFSAGVNPKRKVSSLKNSEIERIFDSIKNILKKAVKMRGTSDSDYRDTEGKSGKFQNELRVYRREGKLCKLCDTKIIREKIGQRSIFYCPVCQK
ncbi:MAG: Formamidopyrimidine-DNA glycosylase [Candidatus Campbellbacteria bacterium GW2011_GWD1_35_49]|nr:MAG: formamidopyrimidine-DNA glycosylase, formamidopyrimidine-DNA glycosylase [Candidatus Campbellbacteria bacterium GW2011_OD1_34_28]KKP74546.1 MAG: Formamidopyrimidine-DNA glycosylase [Candidatus Campbellbacteria bacterium GW2011_GWD2_35_24]KKP76545.1 MAG: Formamidopyrimidine-DNA glycosylase [Candidatus Campbellbacteria bacterium GW2011_GWC1_35_31]KKP78584.1 MAG: Formamidopyrimidine-DNA glycosylase [Candidatus Campbellbacteria bacterium GW2011_GWD1_35_49]HAP74443.1 DNA-formamidopyrimidine 